MRLSFSSSLRENDRSRSVTPPSVLPDISPARREIGYYR